MNKLYKPILLKLLISLLIAGVFIFIRLSHPGICPQINRFTCGYPSFPTKPLWNACWGCYTDGSLIIANFVIPFLIFVISYLAVCVIDPIFSIFNKKRKIKMNYWHTLLNLTLSLIIIFIFITSPYGYTRFSKEMILIYFFIAAIYLVIGLIFDFIIRFLSRKRFNKTAMSLRIIFATIVILVSAGISFFLLAFPGMSSS